MFSRDTAHDLALRILSSDILLPFYIELIFLCVHLRTLDLVALPLEK